MTAVTCGIHPGLLATVRVGARYLCGDCLRDERPILFVTLPQPVDDVTDPTTDQTADR